MNSLHTSSARYKALEPIQLITNPEQYQKEKELRSKNYKEVSSLLNYMENHINQFPKFKAFLWTLTSRDMHGEAFDVCTEEELNEQTKGINMILNLMYWS